MKINTHISKASRNSHIIDILKSSDSEFVDSRAFVGIVKNRNFILTCDIKTVEKWEEFFKLKKHSHWSLQDRIERVLYTKNSRGIFTVESVKENSRLFTNGEVEIEEFYSDYHFTITFISVIGNPPNLENFREFIDTNKPSHLTYDVVFRHRTHEDLGLYPHEHLKGYTHEELNFKGELNA